MLRTRAPTDVCHIGWTLLLCFELERWGCSWWTSQSGLWGWALSSFFFSYFLCLLFLTSSPVLLTVFLCLFFLAISITCLLWVINCRLWKVAWQCSPLSWWLSKLSGWYLVETQPHQLHTQTMSADALCRWPELEREWRKRGRVSSRKWASTGRFMAWSVFQKINSYSSPISTCKMKAICSKSRELYTAKGLTHLIA